MYEDADTLAKMLAWLHEIHEDLQEVPCAVEISSRPDAEVIDKAVDSILDKVHNLIKELEG